MSTTNGDARNLSLPELLGRLSREATALVSAELALARSELAQRSRRVVRAGPAAGVAAMLALGAAGALTACLIAGLATGTPAWFAALLVTIVEGAIAGFFTWRAIAAVMRAGPPVPEATLETLKEDIQWAQTQTPFGRA